MTERPFYRKLDGNLPWAERSHPKGRPTVSSPVNGPITQTIPMKPPTSHPAVLSIVGRKDSGKTALLEHLVRHLTLRGWRVGTFKHDAHGFRMDYEGKDTDRHFQAGANRVLIASDTELAFRRRLTEPLQREALLSHFFQGLDLVITEGYKTGPWPKIEVVRSKRSPEPLCLHDPTLIALFTDLERPFPVPVFELGKPEALAAWVEERFPRGSAGKSEPAENRGHNSIPAFHSTSSSTPTLGPRP